MTVKRNDTASTFPPGPMLGLFSPGGKYYPAKSFLVRVGLWLLMLAFLSVILHVSIDLYGLFRPVQNRAVPVYHEERISKYLLMHRYVPEKFNGLLIGTSLSDNLDVSAYNASQRKLRFYNGSMMGANISEVRKVMEKALDGGIRNVVFCVSPYQFKNSGAKEVELNRSLYYGAFGSVNLYETYAIALIRHFDLMPVRFPKEHINADGVNDFTARYRADDVGERIRQVADIHRGKDFVTDAEALSDFRALIEILQQRKVNYLIYFHPVPGELYDAQIEGYKKFGTMVRSVVNDERRILDLNDSQWAAFTTDYTNYIDNGHLSTKGQGTVLFSVMETFEYIYH